MLKLQLWMKRAQIWALRNSVRKHEIKLVRKKNRLRRALNAERNLSNRNIQFSMIRR